MLNNQVSVNFYFPVNIPSLSHRKALQDFIKQLFKREKIPLSSLNYIFCSDSQLLKLNQDFLNHNFYTDILTFILSEKTKPIMGEIYISVERVRENAVQFGLPFKQELYRVIFHGALHLCGYKDKNRKEKSQMRIREDYYLHLLKKRSI